MGALRTLRQVPQWVNPPEWSNEHAVKLQQFLKSETGAALQQHLRNLHITNCDRLISSPADLSYKTGQAFGFKSALATLDGLATIRSQPDEEVTGVTDDLEWLRQTAN